MILFEAEIGNNSSPCPLLSEEGIKGWWKKFESNMLNI